MEACPSVHSVVDEGCIQTVRLNREKNPGKIVLVFSRYLSGVPSNTKTSIAPNGSWDIWCVHPVHFELPGGFLEMNYQVSTESFRIFRRARRGPINRLGTKRAILGPWCGKTFQTKVDWLTDDVLRPRKGDGSIDVNGSFRFPMVLSGDVPEDIVKLDYNPSDEEVDSDTERDEGKLW
jgi:hypothetical protein